MLSCSTVSYSIQAFSCRLCSSCTREESVCHFEARGLGLKIHHCPSVSENGYLESGSFVLI